MGASVVVLNISLFGPVQQQNTDMLDTKQTGQLEAVRMEQTLLERLYL